MRRSMRKARSFGFTVAEILIVLAVIGLLASIAIPTFIEAIKKKKEREERSARLFNNSLIDSKEKALKH